jgi:hypothetical protein
LIRVRCGTGTPLSRKETVQPVNDCQVTEQEQWRNYYATQLAASDRSGRHGEEDAKTVELSGLVALLALLRRRHTDPGSGVSASADQPVARSLFR